MRLVKLTVRDIPKINFQEYHKLEQCRLIEKVTNHRSGIVYDYDPNLLSVNSIVTEQFYVWCKDMKLAMIQLGRV